MISISTQPTTLITTNPKEEMKPSVGPQPRSVLAFQDLHSTSVATSGLPKRLYRTLS